MTRNFLIIAILLLPVCMPATDARTPGLDRPMPEQWTYSETFGQSLPSQDRWWTSLDDAVLDSLISMGEDANYNLAIACRRMDAASRQMAVARAAYYPQIGLNAGYSRSHQERVSANHWEAGATVNWEIDLFGKITSQVRQKKAQYRASRADWVGAMVSMAAGIADTYVQLRVWEAELQVAREQIKTQDSIAQLVTARYESGLGAKPQVDQAMALLYTTRATIPTLVSSISSAKSSLALLVGRYPADIEPLLESGTGLPQYLQPVSAGVPSELLRRRPDIVAAEQTLAAAAASVGIAKKDFLPTLSLQGSVGVGAARPGDMFTRDGFTYSVAPTLSWTLFDGMARSASVAAARDEMEAQLANYNYTVMNAYNEVENAMTSYVNYTRQITDYESAVRSSTEFLDLELDLYTQGLAPYSDVATAQQNVLANTNSLIMARGNALGALISLYKALGGEFSQYEE